MRERHQHELQPEHQRIAADDQQRSGKRPAGVAGAIEGHEPGEGHRQQRQRDELLQSGQHG